MNDETKKKKVRSLEERKEAYEQKALELEKQIKNKEVKNVWVSEFRKKKSELNKIKELTYIEKIKAFVQWVYEKTEIKVELSNTLIENDFDSDEYTEDTEDTEDEELDEDTEEDEEN